MGTPPASAAAESTSASLIERARDADAVAWQRLVAIYGPLVYRWCRRTNLQEADAADVLQDVLQAVSGKLVTFQPGRDGGFRGWLYGIARHKLADHFRRQPDHERLDEAVAASGGDPASPAAEDANSLTEADDSLFDRAFELHATLEAIRADFDDHNWEAFERTVLQGEAAVDVAADLAITPGAVRQARFRILRRLRHELDIASDC